MVTPSPLLLLLLLLLLFLDSHELVIV